MERPKIRNNVVGPERKIQDSIIQFLEARKWVVMETHGNMYQRGFPDLYAVHKGHGPRWIEVKNAESYCFTPAQLEYFPKLCAAGAGVWIMCAATESEYAKLFKGYNWHWYLLMLNQRGVKTIT